MREAPTAGRTASCASAERAIVRGAVVADVVGPASVLERNVVLPARRRVPNAVDAAWGDPRPMHAAERSRGVLCRERPRDAAVVELEVMCASAAVAEDDRGHLR